MPKILFTEDRLRAFEHMMTQVPNGTKKHEESEDDKNAIKDNKNG